MAHFMRKLQKGLHYMGRVTQGAIGAYGSLKALQAIGGEAAYAFQAARTIASGAAMVAPLALAL
jgi:hypothetical protein